MAYHFPPGQTAGALRWEKLSRFGVERGWGLDVVTLDPASLSIQDPETLEKLPEGVRVFGVPERPTWLDRLDRALFRALRPFVAATRRPRSGPADDGAAPAARTPPRSVPRDAVRFDPLSFGSWFRAYQNVLAAVHERGWALAAARAGRAVFAPDEHRVVVACGPPNMSYEGGRRLARACGLPLVLDMRDPWSLVMRLLAPFASPVFFRIADRFESRAVDAAALVVMNTPLAGRLMQEKYPAAAERILAVPNGCDEGVVPRAYGPEDPFRIAFAGTIYLDRNPASLFRALGRCIRELGLSPGEIEVAFMGDVAQVDGASLESLAEAEGVGDHLRVRPRGTRSEAERFLASAHVLVNLAQDSHVALPSKVFEYMRHEAALLVLAEPGSATHDVFRGTSADLVEPGDVDAIARALAKRYRDHRSGTRPPALASDPRFARRAQADRLFDALDAASAAAGR